MTKRFALTEADRDSPEWIWRCSPIVVGLEHVFYWLEQLSPSTWLFGTRDSVLRKYRGDDPGLVRDTTHRARRIDFYLLSWLAIEAAAVVLGVHLRHWRPVFAAFCAFRLVDIWQTGINITLFGSLRVPQQRVATSQRMVLMLGLNFIEAILCFGVVYVATGHLSKTSAWYDPYYFSTVTQTTVGYGDVLAVSWARMIAVTQSLFGVFFGVLMFARLVSLLPGVLPVQSGYIDPAPGAPLHEPTNDGTPHP